MGSNHAQQETPSPSPPGHPPWQQILIDDIFLLMCLGLAVPTFFYLIWGLMDLASVPVFEP